MASSKLGPRMGALLALTSFGVAVSGSVGCYSTTPHRVQVARQAAPQDCANAIRNVFSDSAFVQLPTPPNLSMLFTPRLAGPYSSFMRTGAGVGVTIDPVGAADGACHVTLEALSPDVSCSDAFVPVSCASSNGTTMSMNAVTGGMIAVGNDARGMLPACPMMAPLMCQLSYAPGESNDAAVDELGRRLQAALGPNAIVN
jgi:hypothetical protein